MQINKNKLYLYFSLILFRVLLELSYTLFVVKEYQYAGFFLNFSINQYILSWFLYLISFIFAKASIKKVSDFFLTISIPTIITPITILYGYNFNYPLLPVLSTILFFLIIYLILKIKIPIKSQFYKIKQGKKIIVFLSSFFVILLISRAVISNVQINFDFKKVYDLRAINGKILSSGVFAYLTTWTYKIFNPILIILSLLRKKYFLSSLFIIIQIYFFAITTHKTVLVFPLIPLFLYFFLSKKKKIYSLIILSNIVICCTLFTYFILDDVWLSSLFSRRAFFVPAQLTFAYFDFFSKHPKVYWSNSVLKYFLDYPYDLSSAHVIGNFFYNSELTGANNGSIASGYAHAGIYGVLLYSIIIGYLLKIIDFISYKKVPLYFSLSLLLIPLLTITLSSDLLTSLLTHGLIIAIIIIYLSYPFNTRRNNKLSKF